MSTIEELKNRAGEILEKQKQSLKELCLEIHANPEPGLQEHRAAGWLGKFLEQNGFTLNQRAGGLPTAFTASYGSGKPVIALLAEYDALPGLGHGCGHNIIGSASAGAAVAAKPAVDTFGGTIVVIGSPSEEFDSGKELLIRRRVMDGLDVAMMVHPGTENVSRIQTLACTGLDVEFNGRQAHASANPEEGINALEAMLLSFNAINSLRQHILDSARIHGIITDGGQAANIIPAHSAARFMVRARNTSYLELLKEKVIACLEGAALATGARLTCHWADVSCEPMKTNTILAGIFDSNMSRLGRIMVTASRDFASTDMGNVSQLAPSIHPFIAIAPKGVSLHSVDFLQAAASGEAVKALEDSALAMAFTIIDILGDEDLLNRIRDEFKMPG